MARPPPQAFGRRERDPATANESLPEAVPRTIEQFAAFVKAESEKYRNIIKDVSVDRPK